MKSLGTDDLTLTKGNRPEYVYDGEHTNQTENNQFNRSPATYS